jgi:hypothetical protein
LEINVSIDYDGVVSICDAHGIGLPVDCVEMVVEIVRHATAQPDHSGDGGEFEVLGHMSINGIERCKANRGGAINSRKTRECDVPVFIRSAQAAQSEEAKP